MKKNELGILTFLIGMFLGGAVVNTVRVNESKILMDDSFEKGALVSLKLLDSIGKETKKDTNRVSCMDFYVDKDTIHVPMHSKAIKMKFKKEK